MKLLKRMTAALALSCNLLHCPVSHQGAVQLGKVAISPLHEPFHLEQQQQQKKIEDLLSCVQSFFFSHEIPSSATDRPLFPPEP